MLAQHVRSCRCCVGRGVILASSIPIVETDGTAFRWFVSNRRAYATLGLQREGTVMVAERRRYRLLCALYDPSESTEPGKYMADRGAVVSELRGLGRYARGDDRDIEICCGGDDSGLPRTWIRSTTRRISNVDGSRIVFPAERIGGLSLTYRELTRKLRS